jgi:hypothetical protein
MMTQPSCRPAGREILRSFVVNANRRRWIVRAEQPIDVGGR